MFGFQAPQREYIQVKAQKGEPGAFAMTHGRTSSWVKTIPNPNYNKAPAAAPAAAPAPAPAPAPTPPPPPVVEKPKVAFDSESYAGSSSQPGAASPFQINRPNAEPRKSFAADTEARDYDGFVKGLNKINTPEATGSESSRDPGAGGMRFAASQKFRDGINERLGIKDQMNDTGEDDDDDAYSWRQKGNRNHFAAGV